ncbi:MAG: hypothetical protein KatS3mg017_0042 [Fimbriimonadales bacterium]|nr:MAG: hypothetical protein KatS3mg017_0042 [Fimbriimonadales bacterium]
MQVAVVGLGAVGSAALRFLARQGCTAVGYEQFALGHTRGSSHGESRIYRLTYADPYYTRLMRRAFELWQELQAESGEALIVPCGVLWLGAENDPELNAIAHALRTEQVEYQWLAPAETTARFPALRVDPSERALFQPEGGFLRASACVAANLRLAQAHGATIREHTRVARIEPRQNHIVIETEDGVRETYDRVVLTAGAWLPKLLPQQRPPLTVTRQTYAYFALQDDAQAHYEPQHLPVWIEATRHFYGFPKRRQASGGESRMASAGRTPRPRRAHTARARSRPCAPARMHRATAERRRRDRPLQCDLPLYQCP